MACTWTSIVLRRWEQKHLGLWQDLRLEQTQKLKLFKNLGAQCFIKSVPEALSVKMPCGWWWYWHIFFNSYIQNREFVVTCFTFWNTVENEIVFSWVHLEKLHLWREMNFKLNFCEGLNTGWLLFLSELCRWAEATSLSWRDLSCRGRLDTWNLICKMASRSAAVGVGVLWE